MSKRVLLVRLDGVGDAMITAPLIAALTAAGHAVGALLSTRNAECFSERALIERHVVERVPWPQHGSTPQTRVRALAEIKAAHYDGALIASEEPEAYSYAKEAGIATRVGFWNGVERPLKSLWIAMQCTRLVHRPATLARTGQHEVDAIFALGAGYITERTPTKDAQRLRGLVASGSSMRTNMLAIQCTKKWIEIGCALDDVVRWLAPLRDRPNVALFASADEAGFAREVGARTNLPLRVFESVRAWIDAIAAAGMMLTPDTGAAHVAGMLGVPTVDVFARECFEEHAARWRPWAAPSRTLAAPSPGDSGNFGVVLGVALDSLGFALPA